MAGGDTFSNGDRLPPLQKNFHDGLDHLLIVHSRLRFWVIHLKTQFLYPRRWQSFCAKSLAIVATTSHLMVRCVVSLHQHAQTAWRSHNYLVVQFFLMAYASEGRSIYPNSNSMIRYILLIVIVISALLLTGADYKGADVPTAKKFCRGYSVIEANKGIDCHGDTIKLVKVHGFFERELKEPA